MGWIGNWAIGVIAVWSLSPLGGQAALRSLRLHQNPTFAEIPATYYLGNNRSIIYQFYRNGAEVFQGSSGAQSFISDMRTVLSASFLTQDVRVSHANTSSPRYNETITGVGGKWEASRYDSDDPNAWISVPEDEVVPYASLIGLPIRDGSFERLGNLTMPFQFHYQTLSCGEAFDGSEWVRNGSKALWYHNTSSSILLSQQFKDEVALGPGYRNTGYPNIWFDFPNSSTLTEHFNASPEMEPQSKMQLVMGAQCNNATASKAVYGATSILRIFDVSISYIDMEVGCIYPVKGNLTALSSLRLSLGIIPELPFTGASQHISEPSILELHLRDPWGIFQRNGGAYMDDPYGSEKLGCFASVPPEVIEQRLALALNTITMSSYEVNVLTGGKGAASTYNLYAPVLWQNTTAIWTEFDKDIYELDTPWFVTTIMVTGILFICAITNIVIRQRIKAPDFLDSLAGLTRDSPFIDVPQDGSGKSGSDRLETIKNVKVRISDVNADEQVGKIALTTELNGSKLR
ncbi:hypothetical protein FPHYL_5401 [Fusarium phyllophilum]|uniref:Uncharacterized protein n=1 Tax=Fusarium phyllophilum TaxID=47803 RepID=A0A8H5JYN0_9HYPO|nr:hypothetical protein FPHYL_5401 [Fusarium phyllophilum]